jgi:hypothetical protein
MTGAFKEVMKEVSKIHAALRQLYEIGDLGDEPNPDVEAILKALHALERGETLPDVEALEP